MTLLAKSKDSKQNMSARTLKEHIDDCLLIYDFIRTAFPSVAKVSGLGEIFWDVLKTAVIFHDLGKAHGEFQKLLNEQPNNWNRQRHELFSIPFLEALAQEDKELMSLLKLVVSGHHKDFEKLQGELPKYEPASFGMLDTLDDEVQTFESAFNRHVDTGAVTNLLKDYGITCSVVQPKPISGLIRFYNKQPYRNGNQRYFALMLLFGGLKWCDHLGSAMVTRLKKLSDNNFNFLFEQQKSLKEKGFDFYAHQKQCAGTVGNTILTAPTGSGKTESALLWTKHQLETNGQARVFYILPFTASINAMYERLKKAMGDEAVGMLHGKLSDYLNNYFDDLQYNSTAKKASIHSLKEKYKSIITPLKVTTPFQLLKHLFGLKGYEQGIFEMSGACLIFDEIHAYSPEVFAQIKVLLQFATKHLDVKVMIMTATLPRFLKTELEQSIGDFTAIKASEELYQSFRRHKVVLKEGLLADNLNDIKSSLLSGMKVLIVCNTVKSAQTIFTELKDSVVGEVLLLNGSFTGADRARIEKDLQQKEVVLLVGTQAIEVSLDIDYDIIFSEPAPIDALIQRFGRVNRKRKKGICDCVVFKSFNTADERIYNSTIVMRTIAALETIIQKNGGVVDEALLQLSIDEVYPDWEESEKMKFDDQYRYLSDALQLLSPMLKNKHTEEDFYKQFDGIKILPQVNKEAYEKHLADYDFISAESQKVQIRKGRFVSWMKSENLKRQTFCFSKGDKINCEDYFITNKVYNSEVGLIADEEEGWKLTEMF